MNNREQFESWVSDNGKSQRTLERKGDIYLLATINTQWEAWQAASKASEQQLAAVVAENAGLNDGALQEIEVINRGGQAYCVKDGMSVNPIYARGWNDYRAKSLSVDTPATDAFLAEVLAQGVETFAAVLRRKGDDSFFDAIAEAQANAADQFAAKLRQGAAL